MLVQFQKKLDVLSVNDLKEFSLHGFSTEDEQQKYIALLFTSKELLCQRYGGVIILNVNTLWIILPQIRIIDFQKRKKRYDVEANKTESE